MTIEELEQSVHEAALTRPRMVLLPVSDARKGPDKWKVWKLDHPARTAVGKALYRVAYRLIHGRSAHTASRLVSVTFTSPNVTPKQAFEEGARMQAAMDRGDFQRIHDLDSHFATNTSEESGDE